MAFEAIFFFLEGSGLSTSSVHKDHTVFTMVQIMMLQYVFHRYYIMLGYKYDINPLQEVSLEEENPKHHPYE